MSYLCENCKNNNNGWCTEKKFNGLKKKDIKVCDSFSDVLLVNDFKPLEKNDYICKTQLTFSDALEVLKNGGKVTRSGWNGKSMWIEYCNGKDHSFSIIEPFFLIKNVKNSFNIWVPSVSDLMAEDWEVV